MIDKDILIASGFEEIEYPDEEIVVYKIKIKLMDLFRSKVFLFKTVEAYEDDVISIEIYQNGEIYATDWEVNTIEGPFLIDKTTGDRPRFPVPGNLDTLGW